MFEFRVLFWFEYEHTGFSKIVFQEIIKKCSAPIILKADNPAVQIDFLFSIQTNWFTNLFFVIVVVMYSA